MKGIVLCRENIRELSAAHKGVSACLVRLCARALLERTLDRLIAAGISEALVLSEKEDERIALALKHYGGTDKIKLMQEKGAAEFFSSAESGLLVFDAVACADIDIAGLLGELSDSERPICLTDKKGRFILAKLSESNVKCIGFTDKINLFPTVFESCLAAPKKALNINNITDVSGYLAHQAQILDKHRITIKSLTESSFGGVTIIPPVFIGSNVTIKQGAVIGKGSVIDDDAFIGQGAQVIGSFVGRGAVVGRNSRLDSAYAADSSVLMNRASLSGGAALCSGVCLRANSAAVGSEFITPESSDFAAISFMRGEKRLFIDDDGVCSLFDGTTDVSAFVRLGKAAASALGLGKSIAVGTSSLDGMTLLADALISGIRSAGADVYSLGNSTLAQLGQAVSSTGSELGIFVGVDANGDLRLVQQAGLPVLSKLEDEICQRYDRAYFRNVCACDAGRLIPAQSEKSAYERFLSSQLPGVFKGLNACVRTGDPVCAQLCDRLFYPANDVSGERIIFRLSGDGITMSAYSEDTGNVRWEQLCLLGCKIMFEQNRPVSLPYSMPLSAESLAQRFQGSIERYCTVSAGDSDAKARETACLKNGSFVRDALLLCVMICAYLQDKRITLRQALEDVGDLCFTQRLVSGCTDELYRLENAQAVGAEGVRVEDGHTSVFIRPSKDRRDLLMFAESTKTEFASAFCDELTEKLAKLRHLRHRAE